MAFDDTELQAIRGALNMLCDRVPAEVRDHVRISYDIDRLSVLVYEERPEWRNPDEWTRCPVAKLRFYRSRGEWELYWMRRDRKWHLYEPAQPCGHIGPTHRSRHVRLLLRLGGF